MFNFIFQMYILIGLYINSNEKKPNAKKELEPFKSV